jgi:predicted AlkP superfamily phosphohydrolase/phosphomutase
MKSISRRDLLKLGLTAGALTQFSQGCRSVIRNAAQRQTRTKMIILGFDGMDPSILAGLMDQGKMPTFRKLKATGDFRPLRTSLPPQSPVAWSNFITGMDPGAHGIFDFIHRMPADYTPYLSTSRVTGGKSITVGNYVLPVSAGKAELLRKGRAFWQILEEHGVPASIVQIPANFPPAPTKQQTLSGMGTPDLVGSYGTFNFYTTDKLELKPDIGGGKINLVSPVDNVIQAELEGPANSLRKGNPPCSISFRVVRDPVNPVAKISIQDHEFILKEGEWSNWKHIRFPMIPTQSTPGICQFYLKEVHPHFKLYVSPVNIDPASPALPISTPAKYSEELAGSIGPFFTKGLPADTKALENGALNEEEFLRQDEGILSESIALFEYELQRFESGLWFHYFSSTDQRQHMFLHLTDPKHPLYDSALAARFGQTVEDVYTKMDKVLARAISKVDDNTIILVMSDHGFSTFRRCFNLNTWLLQNGYLRMLDASKQEEAEYFANTDWDGTRAYALGLNGLYINERGREGSGIVEPGSEKENLIRELAAKLESVVDPQTGERAISRAYATQEAYHGSAVEDAPDIIVGYNRSYRASWATPLGRMPKSLFEDNREKWGADHCMDPALLPGILLANRKINAPSPSLCDLTATILDAFGIEKPPEIIGNSVLK